MRTPGSFGFLCAAILAALLAATAACGNSNGYGGGGTMYPTPMKTPTPMHT